MKKVIIKVQKAVPVGTNETTNVEITIPFYCSNETGRRLYKIYNERECVEIRFDLERRPSMSVHTAEYALYGGYEKITESQFMEKYDEIKNAFENIIL